MPPSPAAGPPAAASALAARLGWNAAGASGPDRIPAVALTDRALAALHDLALPAGAFVRIGVVVGGCSGHTYSAVVDDRADPADLTLVESGHLRVATDPQSAVYLDGLRIDYSDDLIRSGFRFRNAKAGGSCGCGASFKVTP
jgi:iron-sulfur cluster assembly protein